MGKNRREGKSQSHENIEDLINIVSKIISKHEKRTEIDQRQDNVQDHNRVNPRATSTVIPRSEVRKPRTDFKDEIYFSDSVFDNEDSDEDSFITAIPNKHWENVPRKEMNPTDTRKIGVRQKLQFDDEDQERTPPRGKPVRSQPTGTHQQNYRDDSQSKPRRERNYSGGSEEDGRVSRIKSREAGTRGNIHGYEINPFFLDNTSQDKVPKIGTPDYCTLAVNLDLGQVRSRGDMEDGLARIDAWQIRALRRIQQKCSQQTCYGQDVVSVQETCHLVKRTWKSLCDQYYSNHSQPVSQANGSEYYPDPRDLLSTFPIHFSQRDAGLKDSHFNRLNKLNVDTVSSTLEQAYQVYTFLCSCTSMKNQFAELSQKNLVALILDRIKESTLARQVTEMIEEKLMERRYNDNYYVYHVYKFMEDLFCEPLKNSSTVLTLMDKERMQGRTVQSYIEALRPLCRLYVQCISPNLSEQKKLLERVLKDKLLSFLPMRVVSTLQGIHQDPGFQTTALTVLLGSLKQLEQVNDRRRQTTEDINQVSRTRKIHQINQDKWEEAETDLHSSGFEIESDPTRSPEPDTINMFGLKFGDKRVMINPKLANTDEKACYKCNHPSHPSNSKDCIYVGIPLTMTPCENCKVGLHPTSKCKKTKTIRTTDVNALFQKKKGKPELKLTRGTNKTRASPSRFLFRGKRSEKPKPSISYIEFEAEEQEVETDDTPCLSPQDSSDVIAMIDWEIGQEDDSMEEEEETQE